MTSSTQVTKPIASSATQRSFFSAASPGFLSSILATISLALWWRPLSSTFDLALHNDQFTHILLILPISAALIFLDWKSAAQATSGLRKIASVVLLATVLADTIVRWSAPSLSSDLQLSLSMLALVVWWMASFALCFGDQAFRRALFSLCFLLWMVPFPDLVLNPIVAGLQQGSAVAAHLLFAAVRVPVEQRGVLLHIPGLTLEVARECSSMRSSAMLVVTSMVLAHLLLRSPWRRALVIMGAIPLSIAKNGLRIFVIAMLATRVDRSFLTGRLHRQGGVIFLLIALAAIFLLIWILRKGEEKTGRSEDKSSARSESDPELRTNSAMR